MRDLDILMLTHERQLYFEKTLDCITSQRSKFNIRLHVIDNNSSSEFVECLEDHLSAGDIQTLYLNDKNEGVPSFNKILPFATSNPFMMTDPDLVGPENWLEDMFTVWDTRAKELNLAKLSVNLDGSNCKQKWAHFPIDEPIKSEKIFVGNVALSYVGTWLSLYDLDAMKQINRYDQDNSFHDDATRLGYKIGFARDIKAYHLGFDDWRDYPEFLLGKSTGILCPGLENRPEVEYISNEVKEKWRKDNGSQK